VKPFDFRDGERRIHFGRGRLAEAVELLGGPGFTLLTTERTEASAPAVVAAAGAVHHVRSGLVDEIAAELLEEVTGELVVALGGGRVIDTAKAIVAARGSGRAAAIPTTLSGAEMTRTHRVVKGTKASVRAAIVVNDPVLCASQPVAELAASALNGLGHAIEGPLTPKANPVATLAAEEGARLLTGAFAGEEPDREALALGALLAGYAIDSQGYGLHHVLSQTMVRAGGAGHGPANAVLLPHTIRALARRFPGRGLRPDAAERLLGLTGATSLRQLGVEREALARCADAAAQRTADLANTPPPADRDEILSIYEAAW
jgi:alcohol dehydrogenase class IV